MATLGHTIAELSQAWAQGGTRAVAALLSCDQKRAGSVISNLRRVHPEAFPRRASAKVPRSHILWRLKEALRHCQEGNPALAIPFLEAVIEQKAAAKRAKEPEPPAL